MRNVIEQTGFEYLLDGFKLLNHPRLRAFVLVPLIINIIIFSLLTWLAAHFFSELLNYVNGFLPSWLHWLSWLFWLLFAIADLVIMAYCFTLVANLIAAPFNSILAERATAIFTGVEVTDTSSFWKSIIEIPQAMLRAAQWLLYYLPRAIMGLILFIIPGVNAGAPIVWFLINAWTMALQYADYPADNNKTSFKQMRQCANQNRLRFLGFGSAILLFTMIPIVNFFVMPAAVIGASKIWLNNQHA
jgi:CysZ protein